MPEERADIFYACLMNRVHRYRVLGDMRMAEMLRDASRPAVFLDNPPEMLTTDVEQRFPA
jgi:hypothetical protein